MPFDGLPESLLSDLVKLRIAADGIRGGWKQCKFGLSDEEKHCAIGWLLVATDWDQAEATRLAVDYLYPALPAKSRKSSRLRSVWKYNDDQKHADVVALFENAMVLAGG